MLRYIAVFAFLSAAIARGETLLSVSFEDMHGKGHLNLHFIGIAKDGFVSLRTIPGAGKLSKVRVDDVVTALEKIYPDMVGRITLNKSEEDITKLVEEGKVRVSGMVESAGFFTPASLGEVMTAAKVTRFSATSRIQVIRKGDAFLYDLRNKDHSAVLLEPGDFIIVPWRRAVGG